MNEAQKRCPEFAELIREQPDEKELFGLVVKCFSSWLSTVARQTCGNDTVAQDAFQDAMIAVQAHLGSYRGEAPIEPWLRKIVSSSCSRLRRGKKNDPKLNISVDPMELGATASGESMSQEDHLLMREKFGQLLQAVDTLEEPNRSLLLFHDSGEKSIRELATRYAMTDEAVKSRLKRARARVRTKLTRVASQTAG